MAQPTRRGAQPTGGKGRDGTGGRPRASSRRAAPVVVKKPFPWGFAAGVLVLVLFLGAILGYAVFHKGTGLTTALDKADKAFPGLQVTANQSQNHTGNRVTYPDEATRAPDGGNHNPVWQTCAVYDAAIVPEHAVHSLEHGAVWVTYRPDLPAAEVTTLKSEVDGVPYRLMSPYPGQTSPVALQAWGRRLDVSSASDPKVAAFLQTYTDGPQTREKGASCSGGVDQPGSVPFVQGADGTFVPGNAGTATTPASSAP